MKKLYFLLFALMIGITSFGQTTVFINELHYDNASSDVGEGVEVAGPAGTDLSTYTITPYNGNGGGTYSAIALSGTIPDEGAGFGTLWFAISGLQNGAPDGIALDNGGALIQFLSYEGSFTATAGPANGVTSTDIGVSETSSTPAGESLQLIGTGDTYEEFTWSGPTTASTGSINVGQTFSGANPPGININSPADATVFDPGTTSVDVTWTTVNLTGGEIVNVTVNGTTSFDQTSPFSVTTADGQTYNITVDLDDGGGGILDSDMVSFSVESLTQVNDIATLRGSAQGAFYELTGEAFLTYQQSFRNQKFIEDSTGGILIDDTAGSITTMYNIGDGITGIVGELSEFGGMIQFVPSQDPGVASSTGNTLTPQSVTLADLSAAPENYESELVVVSGVTMDNSTPNFSGGSVHTMTQGVDTFDFRSTFFSSDYVDQGAAVPTVPTDITGIINERSGNAYYLTAREAADFSVPILSESDFENISFNLFPNPTSIGFVNISSVNSDEINAKVFDILGKQVLESSVENNQLNVSNLNAGVYILRLTQNNASVTKKLVIQ